jgi:tRNA pseudouridine38-40 synthase
VPRYKLTLAYEGAEFCGWQRQLPHEDAVPSALTLAPDPGLESITAGQDGSTDATPAPQATIDAESDRPRVELRTVQAVLERAVRYVTREPIVVMGASRTDAGVHARGQVAAFTCSDRPAKAGGGWPIERGTDTLVRAINARLPDDVLVLSAEAVGPEFDPIGDCTTKGYSYRIYTGKDRPLWGRRTCLHIWHELDASRMHDAAQAVIGEHDFAAFAAAGHGRKSTVRTVFDCRVTEETRPEGGRMIVMTISGNGFLWNMVRIIAGTLVEAGRGKIGPEHVRAALASGDRRLAGPTLPAHGLTLEWIRYD